MIAVFLMIFAGFKAFSRALRRPENQAVILSGLVVLAVGVTFYTLHEGWNIADSIYFCVVTLTTVGYGDLHPTTTASRLFTVGYIVAGLGVMGATISVIVQQVGDHLRRATSETRTGDG